jgi:site-specific recombinase XerD
MNAFVSAYLNYLKEICGFAKRTIDFHYRICRWWETFLGQEINKPLLAAMPEDLLVWIVHRQNMGIQPVTIRKEMCILRTFYQYCHDYGHIDLNPAASLPKVICNPTDEQAWLTVEECFDFLGAFDSDTKDGYRNHAIVSLLWSTGLRSAELCALKWHDIDLDDGTLLVRKGKGGKQRLLYLNDRIWDQMRQYYKKTNGKNDDSVFCALTNNQFTKGTQCRGLTQSSLVDMIRYHAYNNGFTKPVSPKTFRHSFATHMVEAGVRIEDIKEMLGHDDETETCIYIHVTLDTAKRFLEDHIGNPERYF